MKLTREAMFEQLKQTRIPRYMYEGIVEYVFAGRPVGNFLTAVFSNDLKQACDRADDTNKHLLYEYVFFLYNHAPRACWGSEQNVLTWMSHRGMEFTTEGETDGSQR